MVPGWFDFGMMGFGCLDRRPGLSIQESRDCESGTVTSVGWGRDVFWSFLFVGYVVHSLLAARWVRGTACFRAIEARVSVWFGVFRLGWVCGGGICEAAGREFGLGGRLGEYLRVAGDCGERFGQYGVLRRMEQAREKEAAGCSLCSECILTVACSGVSRGGGSRGEGA